MARPANKMKTLTLVNLLVLVGLSRCLELPGELANFSDLCQANDNFYEEGPDCFKYVNCSHGKLAFFTCPRTSYWNQRRRACDEKRNVAGCLPDGQYLDLPASFDSDTSGDKPTKELNAEDQTSEGPGEEEGAEHGCGRQRWKKHIKFWESALVSPRTG